MPVPKNSKGNFKLLLNPNCSEIILRLNNFSREKILKELEMIGIIEFEISESEFFEDDAYEEKFTLLADKDNPNVPDFTEHATLQLTVDDFDKLIIEAFQHTEKQLFPSMLKIIEHFKKNLPEFNEEWIGYGGGWADIYKEWIEQGRPEINDFQDERSKELRKRYCNFE